MKPRISVLMGIYNCEATLAESIDSLYSQTYTDFKLILCDDGSSDHTYQVAKEYEDKCDNIILLQNERNLKLAATLNRCLEHVDTEYIARMDGDDISLPERFEKEISFLDGHPEYALVSTPMIRFDENGDWGIGQLNPRPTKYSFRVGRPHRHAPCMIRTSAMEAVGGYTDNKWTIRREDYYLWYKLYKQGYKGYNLQEPLYKMRDGEEALSRRTFKERCKSFVVRYRVMKDLDISYPFVYALFSLIKGFVPGFIMRRIRKKRMTI